MEFFEIDKIFNPLEIKKEEFFKKKILKPEEDVFFKLNFSFFLG